MFSGQGHCVEHMVEAGRNLQVDNLKLYFAITPCIYKQCTYLRLKSNCLGALVCLLANGSTSELPEEEPTFCGNLSIPGKPFR